jgi:proteasome lid subunit RPN8/RPN11
MLSLRRQHVNELFAHARGSDPEECCGLIGGSIDGAAHTIYRLRNVARDTSVAYEAAPEELFAAQREMRRRGEELIAIYHSHPRATDPEPSDTDVRLAYYPMATYLIIGLAGTEPSLRAFRIFEQDLRWQPVEYEIAGE